MISYQDCRTCCTEIIVRIFDDKCYTGRKPHCPFERASDGPLRYAIVSYETEENRYEDSITSAKDQRNVTGEETGEETCERHNRRKHVERESENDIDY